MVFQKKLQSQKNPKKIPSKKTQRLSYNKHDTRGTWAKRARHSEDHSPKTTPHRTPVSGAPCTVPPNCEKVNLYSNTNIIRKPENPAAEKVKWRETRGNRPTCQVTGRPASGQPPLHLSLVSQLLPGAVLLGALVAPRPSKPSKLLASCSCSIMSSSPSVWWAPEASTVPWWEGQGILLGHWRGAATMP